MAGQEIAQGPDHRIGCERRRGEGEGLLFYLVRRDIGDQGAAQTAAKDRLATGHPPQGGRYGAVFVIYFGMCETDGEKRELACLNVFGGALPDKYARAHALGGKARDDRHPWPGIYSDQDDQAQQEKINDLACDLHGIIFWLFSRRCKRCSQKDCADLPCGDLRSRSSTPADPAPGSKHPLRPRCR